MNPFCFRAVRFGCIGLLAFLALSGPDCASPGATPGIAAGTAHPDQWPSAGRRASLDPRSESAIDRLLGRMSLEEKVGQMIQADVSSVRPGDLREVPLGSILAGGNTRALGAADLRVPASAWIATAQAFDAVAREKRDGHVPIPLMFGVDAVHGNSHVPGATVFPHNIALGASGDADLVQRIGSATALEALASGFDWVFGPTVAVPQDLRWGRSYEGFSEDPTLVRRLGAAMVRGLQGEVGSSNLLARGHVAASAKHFLADGGTLGGVDQGNAEIDEKTLIETHLPGYLGALDAGVLTVMVSYSSWQGVKMSANRSLLTDVLKGRLGFEGFVVGDWNSHGQVPGCSNDSCPAAINSGIDMLMAPEDWKALYRHTLEQVRSGAIGLARIDDAVRRILRVKASLGLLPVDSPLRSGNSLSRGAQGDILGNAEHRMLARRAVRESLVLLKNNGGVLPVRADARVLIAGPSADDIGRQCGGWTLSWQGADAHNSDFPGAESIAAGLRVAIEGAGGTVDFRPDGEFEVRPDVAIVVFGEMPYAEGWGDLKSLEYQPGEKSDLLLMQRLRSKGVPIIAVFLSGRPLWVNPEINAADAFVAAWLPGTEGGAIADVLVGTSEGRPRNDFSGRLPFTWPARAVAPSGNAPARARAAQFPVGYGLNYASRVHVGQLPDKSGVDAAVSNFSQYMVGGRSVAPWQVQLRSVQGSVQEARSPRTSAPVPSLTDGILDTPAPESGREIRWMGSGTAALAMSGPPMDMRMLANGGAALKIRYLVAARPDAPTLLGISCNRDCGASLDLTPTLLAADPGQWREVRVRLSCFAEAGADLSRVTEPFVVTTAGHLRLVIADVRLVADPAGATCLQ